DPLEAQDDEERRNRRNAEDMNVISSALQAIGLFLVTNIDDIIVLSLFFARGAGQRGTTTKIVVGQYLGFGGILLASLAVTFGAGLFLPDAAIPYFGFIPLLLGGHAAWQAWRNGDVGGDTFADKPISALAVAAVTFANGGDNIGVYVPVFLAVGTGALVAYCVVFLALVAVLVLAAELLRWCWSAGSTSCSRSSSSCSASSS
ncbi:MAG: cadmium resistance transporter, partial [Candidatus Nanopelagicales bacterium]|nr:cadmium resistance transporter [Candidatus Nanopelagicales bacterium]